MQITKRSETHKTKKNNPISKWYKRTYNKTK